MRSRFGRFRRRSGGFYSRNFALFSTFSSPGTGGGAFPATVGATDVMLIDITSAAGQDMQHVSKKLAVANITYTSDICWPNLTTKPSDLEPEILVNFCEGVYKDDIGTNDAPEVAGSVFLMQDATNLAVDLRAFPDRILHRRMALLPTWQDVTSPSVPQSLQYRAPMWGLPQHIRRRVSTEPDQALFFRIEVDSGAVDARTYQWSAFGVITYRVRT